MHTLKIENLTVSVEGQTILKNFNLEMKSGEIHAIMGPNGTGKSTLTKVIMGDKKYKIEKGKIFYDEQDITSLEVDERARLGIFLAMQNPLEIDGVTNADFLRTALRAKNNDDFKLFPFMKDLDKYVDKLKMDKEMIHRGVNIGFSGGERKKNEILQMYMLKPNFVMLDEIDSGLDVDSLKVVGNNVMDYFEEEKPCILVITHYKRLLDYIKPNFIHIMKDGHILKTGGLEIAQEIETSGYEELGENHE